MTTSDSSERPSRLRTSSGVTLIEIVVVIVILSLLLGLSVALFRNASRDLGVRASAHHFVGLLRNAHEQSKMTRSPSWVVVSVDEKSLYSVTRETVGEWHFEDTVTTGALGRNGRVTNGVLVPGRIGNAMQFAGSTTVDCGELPILSEDQGITVEFWYYRVDVPRRQTLCAIGSQLEVSVEANARLSVTLGDTSVNSGQMFLRTADLWYRVAIVYDTREIALWVNDVPVGTRAAKLKWAKGQRLVIGAAKNGLQGILDEFRLGVIVPREKYILPGEARFELPHGYLAKDQKEFVIHFDNEGRLDRRKHAQALRIRIKSRAEEKEITILPTGLIQR